jgi:ribosomal protein S7
MTKCGLKYKVFLFFYSFLFLLKIKIKSIYVNVGLNRCYTSINRIKKNKKINIGLYFLKLLHKLSPKFKFLTTNKAGKTYKIPVTIKSYTQSYSLLLRWVVKNAKLRLEKGFALKFIAELFDLKNKRGKTFTAIETYKLLVKDTLSHLTYYDP